VQDQYGQPISDYERQRRLDRDIERRGIMMAGGPAREGPELNYARRQNRIWHGTEKLQTANEKLQQAIRPNAAPDYKHISEYASKIREIGKRLRTQLAIPKAGPEEKPANNWATFSHEQLIISVQSLNRSINLFLTNDIVLTPARAVNARLLAEAGHDLGDLQAQSYRVKRIAQALRQRK
jgi:hypothetical protein